MSEYTPINPGKPYECEVCGETVPWIEREFPHLSGWGECPGHASLQQLKALNAELVAALGQLLSHCAHHAHVPKAVSLNAQRVFREASEHLKVPTQGDEG